MALEIRDRIAGKLRNLMSAPLERGTKRAVVVAVASSKGGVGKTTTAVNLAVGLARRGARVLLCDLDPQAHVAASLHWEPPVGGHQLPDVLLGRLREVCEVAYPSLWNRLDLAGSDKTLAETELLLSAKIGKELILEGAMEVTRTRYDIVLFDCPPNLGTLTLNALCAAGHLLVPSDMSILALEGVSDILSTVDTLHARLGRRVELCGILVTRFDRRLTQMNSTIAQSFSDLYGERLLQTRIPQSSALNRAHLAGQPIFDFAPRSAGAVAYAALADEIIDRLGVPVEGAMGTDTVAQQVVPRSA